MLRLSSTSLNNGRLAAARAAAPTAAMSPPLVPGRAGAPLAVGGVGTTAAVLLVIVLSPLMRRERNLRWIQPWHHGHTGEGVRGGTHRPVVISVTPDTMDVERLGREPSTADGASDARPVCRRSCAPCLVRRPTTASRSSSFRMNGDSPEPRHRAGKARHAQTRAGTHVT